MFTKVGSMKKMIGFVSEEGEGNWWMQEYVKWEACIYTVYSIVKIHDFSE